MKTEFSPVALADLEEIALYIARDNPRAAEQWIDRLIDRAEKAAVLPRAGKIVRELGDPDIREVYLRTYRIVYRIETKRILVLTVFEGHRQLRRGSLLGAAAGAVGAERPGARKRK
jgi:addiction module RelE/StbE family toxin